MSRSARRWASVVVCVSLVFLAFSTLAVAKKDKNAEKRAEIDAMAAKALETVLSKSPEAKALYGKAVGHAAFENLKIAIGVSGGGGSGVAVPKSGNRVYMKMGTAGIGLGLGGQKYQVVFLFENEQAFKSFVDKGWQADASAQAAAADKGADAAGTFKNGVAVYQLTDKGLIASADIAGTKYWKNDDLNK